MHKPGTYVKALSKSLHEGQTGVVVADYGSHVLVKVHDETYSGAGKNSIGEGKYIQIDSLLALEYEPKEN